MASSLIKKEYLETTVTITTNVNGDAVVPIPWEKFISGISKSYEAFAIFRRSGTGNTVAHCTDSSNQSYVNQSVEIFFRYLP